MNSPARRPLPDPGEETPGPGGQRAHPPWRAAGVGLTSLATPIGAGVADPLFGEIIAAVEIAVMLVILGSALFGSQALSERAFRLLRWFGNRPEPPAPEAPVAPLSPSPPGS